MSAINYVRNGNFNLNWQVGTENSVFIGAHGQGKTLHAAYFIAFALLGQFRLWAWDYHDKIFQYLMRRRLTPQQQKLLTASRIRLVSDVDAGTRFIFPYDKSEAAFMQFCEKISYMHDLHIIIDELHNYNSAHRIPAPLAHLVRDMGNRNVSYTAIFQRPAENHKSIISNTTHRFIFGLDLPNDIKYLRQWIGTEIDLFLDPALRTFHKNEPRLPLHSFIYRNVNEQQPVVVVGGLRL